MPISSMLKRGLIGLVLMTLALGLWLGSQADATPSKGSLNTYIWNTYRGIENEDPDKSYLAVLELESIGIDVLPFCIQRLPQIEDSSGLSAAFILGEVENSDVIPSLLKVLQGSYFKGDNNATEDGDGAEGGTSANIERFRNIRDGFICTALGLQLTRLSEDNPEDVALFEEVSTQLRSYLTPGNTRNVFVKVCATLAMGMRLDNQSFALMKDVVLNREENMRFRAACILGLSGVPNEECAEIMRTVLGWLPDKKNKKSNRRLEYLQEHAALALGAAGNPGDLPLLYKVLSRQTSEQGRAHTWVSIGDLADPSSLAQAQELLLDEKSSKVQTAAARTLFLLGDPDTAYLTLENVLYQPNAPTALLQYAAQMLGSLTDLRTKDMLVQLLNHSNIEVRRLAVANLVKFCNVHLDVRDMLLDMAANTSLDPTMRQQATLAFMHWESSEENIKVMSRAAKATNPIKRCVALSLQNRAPDANVIRLLRTLMADKDALVRGYAATAYATTAMHMEKDDHMLLKKLWKVDDTFLVKKDAYDALRAIKETNPQLLASKLNRYWKHESNTPNDIWEEFWEHAMVRLLMNSANEAGSRGEEQEGNIVDREVQEPSSYDPVSCRYTPGATRTVREVVKTEVLDPGVIAQKVITEMVKKRYYGPKKSISTVEADTSNDNDTDSDTENDTDNNSDGDN